MSPAVGTWLKKLWLTKDSSSKLYFILFCKFCLNTSFIVVFTLPTFIFKASWVLMPFLVCNIFVWVGLDIYLYDL